jgi:CRISPR-associated protein Csy2
MKRLLLIPKLGIHNANALSSPYTIGFPAMTAWLGGVHALERQIRKLGYEEVRFKSVAVICHSINLQTYKGRGDYVFSIIGTGNPLDKNGERPSFIEEARCHLTVSLLIECENIESYNANFDEFIQRIVLLLKGRFKIASGDIINCELPELIDVDDEFKLRKLLRRLMPGYCLIERRDLMKKAMQEGNDCLDALLDYIKVTHRSEIKEDGTVEWTSCRKENGWIVPIATGFHGISDLGKADNQRDPETPHRFAESIVTLGEFIIPYSINELDEMLWHYHFDSENDLYLCQQKQPYSFN